MSDKTPSPDILNDLISAALKAGADAAEAVSAHRASLSVGVRNGALEDVEREEARDLGLRVFIGRRQATVSASDTREKPSIEEPSKPMPSLNAPSSSAGASATEAVQRLESLEIETGFSPPF